MTIQKYSWIEFVSELIDFANLTLIDQINIDLNNDSMICHFFILVL